MSGVDPRIPGNRTRANRIRKALARGTVVPDVDQLWLAEYVENQKKYKTRTGAEAAAAVKDFGASRSKSGRKVKFEMEEAAEAESIGTGGAAASAALAAKEEGRRLDSLTTGAISALHEAVEVYKAITRNLNSRLEIIENAHVNMMESTREHYLARVETEAEMTRLRAASEGAGDPADQMLMEVIGQHFGLTPKPRAGGTTRANGHPKPNGST